MKTIECILRLLVIASAVTLPLINLLGIAQGNWLSWSGVLIVFLVYSMIEIVMYLLGMGIMQDDKPLDLVSDWFMQHGFKIATVLHLFCLPISLYFLIFDSKLTPFSFFGAILSLAVASGSTVGIAAHEYIHSSDAFWRRLGSFIYATFMYGHFTLTHVLGHHRFVGLEKDWNTPRPNQNVYSYLLRAIPSGFINAWSYKQESAQVFLLRIMGIQITIVFMILLFSGGKGVAIYGLYCISSIIILEMLNYIPHFGTQRQVVNGVPEPIRDEHSWESNHKVTNWFVLNTANHVHHHSKPSLPNIGLKPANQNRCLPFGLAHMTLLSFVPPIYFSVMNRRISEASQLNLG